MSESTLRRCLKEVRWGGGHPNVVVVVRRDVARALDCVTALRELVADYEESDPYPTSDAHPLYAARAALTKLDSVP